ncbi:MAG: type II toxin-antitoxin system HicB family antitoxin, partial [Planctomycetota bacterium]
MIESQYEMIIFWDKTDTIYVVDVPELPGCMAHGKSKKEALENAEKSVALWLKTA